MKWKSKFREMILERGRQYYKRNRVYELSYENDTFEARVLGEKPYDVQIKISEDKVVSMKCSCPYAVSGQKCKHMAAVMYAIEAEGSKLIHEQELFKDKERPFQRKEDEYQYFDLVKMVSDFTITDTKLYQAEMLIHNKEITLEHVKIGYNSYARNSQMIGTVTGTYMSERYPKTITITFNKEKIIKAYCMVSKCENYFEYGYYFGNKKLCVHMIALLILLEDYLKKYKPGDSTDQNGMAVFQGYRNLNAKKVVESSDEVLRDVILEPVLEKKGEAFYATFKVGTDKLYVVKNLTEFVNFYDNKERLPLGTKSELSFLKHRISEKCEKIYLFIDKIVKEQIYRINHMRTSTHFYTSEEEVKSRIELYGERLDIFFELLKGQKILYVDKNQLRAEKNMVTVCQGNPQVQLKIEKDVDSANMFHGIKVTGKMPDVTEGGRNFYFCTNENFCRVDKKIENAIQPLFELSENGSIEFYVGRKHLAEFYHQVLPTLEECAEIEKADTEIIQEYIPPAAVFAFYLDVENGNITCKAEAKYGENTISLIENLKDNQIVEDFRNLIREQEILYHVQKMFPEVDFEKEEFHCGENEEIVFQVLESGVDMLMTLGEVHTTDRFRKLNIRRRTKFTVGVSVESDIMNLSVTSDVIEQDELLQLLRSYKRKKKYYRLKNGDFVAVNEEDIEVLSQLMNTLHLTPKEFTKGNMKVPVYRALYLNKMLEQGENIYFSRDKYFKNLIKEFKTVEDSDFEVPESLTGIMRNYQVRGFKWMKTLKQYGFGGILADDMGLGKTLQMISVLVTAKEENSLGTALIVAPASLVYNWKEEFERFAPELIVTLVVGNQQERVALI